VTGDPPAADEPPVCCGSNSKHEIRKNFKTGKWNEENEDRPSAIEDWETYSGQTYCEAVAVRSLGSGEVSSANLAATPGIGTTTPRGRAAGTEYLNRYTEVTNR